MIQIRKKYRNMPAILFYDGDSYSGFKDFKGNQKCVIITNPNNLDDKILNGDKRAIPILNTERDYQKYIEVIENLYQNYIESN